MCTLAKEMLGRRRTNQGAIQANQDSVPVRATSRRVTGNVSAERDTERRYGARARSINGGLLLCSQPRRLCTGKNERNERRERRSESRVQGVDKLPLLATAEGSPGSLNQVEISSARSLS